MTETLTLKRAAVRDVILVPLTVFNTSTGGGVQINAELDTGNDHTCVRMELLNQLGVSVGGSGIAVHGVTGSSTAARAHLTFGFMCDGGKRITVDSHEIVVLPALSCPILLGRDMLEFFDVSLRRDGSATLSFCEEAGAD